MTHQSFPSPADRNVCKKQEVHRAEQAWSTLSLLLIGLAFLGSLYYFGALLLVVVFVSRLASQITGLLGWLRMCWISCAALALFLAFSTLVFRGIRNKELRLAPFMILIIIAIVVPVGDWLLCGPDVIVVSGHVRHPINMLFWLWY